MKKKLFLILSLFLFASVILLIKTSASREIRVKIIPNSNSDSDLEYKQEVKEKVVVFLAECYDENYQQYCENISNNLVSLEISDTICTLEYHTFYNKTYNNSSIKNEKVLTFLVKIGEAKGDNWWGSIYPTFLDIQSSDVVEYKSYIVETVKKWKEKKDD